MSQAPYFLFLAPDWTPTSNGVCSIHQLAHKVREYGQRAYLTPCVKNPEHHDTPLWSKTVTGDAIAVYPEGVQGNPLGAKTVARWILYYQWHSFVGLGDLFFVWDRAYDTTRQFYPILRVQTIDEGVFHPPGEGTERSGGCYFARKYKHGGNKVHRHIEQTCIDLDTVNPGDKQALADIFRRSEYLVCYEESAVTDEAMLCGCPTIEGARKSLADLRHEISTANDNLPLYRARYDRFKLEEELMVRRFISLCLKKAESA